MNENAKEVSLSLICTLCRTPFMPSEKSFLVKGRMHKTIGVCPRCHGEIFQHGTRFTADIMIVPVKRESLVGAIKRKVYICPDHYVKRNPKLIAFYVGDEVGAITHLAMVRDIRSEVPDTEIFEARCDEKRSKWEKHALFKLFTLGTVLELKDPIRRAKIPIQGRIYVSFEAFSRAKSITDLFKTHQ